MAPPQPYTINVSDEKVDHLKHKLAITDFPQDAADFDATSWAQGPPVKEIQRLALYWQTEYDWRSAEAQLNKLPQFTTSIAVDELEQTFNIHFVHQQSTKANAIPLLFLHGWPGSFIEVTRIIQGLTKGDDKGTGPAFHVVAPSLVDFGFSSPSTVRLIRKAQTTQPSAMIDPSLLGPHRKGSACSIMLLSTIS
jgi:hypothetical protein